MHTDGLEKCRAEGLRKALRQLGTTPAHLQDIKKPDLLVWIRDNCDVEEVKALAMSNGGAISAQALRIQQARS